MKYLKRQAIAHQIQFCAASFAAVLFVASQSQIHNWYVTVTLSAAVSVGLTALVHLYVARSSLYDPLTRALRREVLMQCLDHLVKRDLPFTLIQIEIERFRLINGTLGISGGDSALKSCADRIHGYAGGAALLARAADSKLVLLFERALNNRDTLALERDLKSLFSAPVYVAEVSLELALCLGVSKFPQDGATAADVLRASSVALEHSKNERVGLAQYSKSIDPYSRDQLILAAGLRAAIENEEIELLYQPKLDLRTGQVNSFEALVRWNHPELGLLMPGRFIHIAETTGHIRELTPWIFDRAVSQLEQWDAAGMPDLRLAINASAQCLTQATLSRFLERLSRSLVSPSRITIEVTETSIMSNIEACAKILACFSVMGLKLSVDDFGTGHSSMIYLRQMPINEVKIDRVFVANMFSNDQDLKIIRSIIELAHDLNCNAVAEGVETYEALDELRRRGCDLIQGFFISKPLPATSITKEYISILEGVVPHDHNSAC